MDIVDGLMAGWLIIDRNGADWVLAQLTELDTELDGWLTSLPPSLQYQPDAPPTVFVLQ
jgi:hypothetical protein